MLTAFKPEHIECKPRYKMSEKDLPRSSQEVFSFGTEISTALKSENTERKPPLGPLDSKDANSLTVPGHTPKVEQNEPLNPNLYNALSNDLTTRKSGPRRERKTQGGIIKSSTARTQIGSRQAIENIPKRTQTGSRLIRRRTRQEDGENEGKRHRMFCQNV
jgi:hypothetical protein